MIQYTTPSRIWDHSTMADGDYFNTEYTRLYANSEELESMIVNFDQPQIRIGSFVIQFNSTDQSLDFIMD